MKLFKTLFITTLVVIGIFSITPDLVGAQGAKTNLCGGASIELVNPECGNTLNQSDNKLTSTIRAIVTVISVIVGFIAVVMVIISGFKYITSNGDSNAISSAKNTLIYALVGLVIVALAQVIVRFILSRLG